MKKEINYSVDLSTLKSFEKEFDEKYLDKINPNGITGKDDIGRTYTQK